MMNIPIQWGRGFAGSLADDAGVETDGRIRKKKRSATETRKSNAKGWRGDDQEGEVVDEVRLASESGRGEVEDEDEEGLLWDQCGMCIERTSHTCNGITAEIH